MGPFCFVGGGCAPHPLSALLDTATRWVSHRQMKSRLADIARRRLSEDLRRMTPEQRLAAYVFHCQLMSQLCLAGRTNHQRQKTSAPGHAE
jgi:hypothetical protein